MARGLKLIKYTLGNVNYRWVGAFRLRVEVTEVENDTDPNIFLFLRNPPNPYTGVTLDTFAAIAGPVDMSDYPPFDPDPNAEFPYFRLNYFEVDLRATSEADTVWKLTVSQVNRLLLALDRMEHLVPVEEVWVRTTGGPHDTVSDACSESALSESSSCPR